MPDEPGAPCAAREAGAFVHRPPLRLGLPCVRLRHCPQGWRELPGRGAEGHGQQRRLRRCRAAAGDLGGGRGQGGGIPGCWDAEAPAPAGEGQLAHSRTPSARTGRPAPASVVSCTSSPRGLVQWGGGPMRAAGRGRFLSEACRRCLLCFRRHRINVTQEVPDSASGPKHPQNMTSSRALPPAPKGPNHPLWLRVVCV